MANFILSGSGGGRRESVVQRQAKINAACSSFIAIGFRLELFTINNLHSYGYTENKFLEFIKPISSITDLNYLRYLFNTARQSLYHDLSVILPPNDFFDFLNCMNWLKIELSAWMKKKEMSKADVALARKLVDSAAPLRLERKRIQSAIDELKKRQMERERESARISAELKLKLGPIYRYEEPSTAELRTESYLVYKEDCRFRGIIVIPKLEEMGSEMLVDTFGGTVKERHLIKFLNDPVRKELTETFLKGFAAMTGYKEPSIEELRTECYLLYEKDCRSIGMTIIPKLDERGYPNSMEDVMAVFGGIVKERHFVKFLNDPARKEIIETYLKEFNARW